MVIVLNDDLDWSRGKRAAHAAHAALAAYGVTYSHAIVVLRARTRDVRGAEYTFPGDSEMCRLERSETCLKLWVVIGNTATRDDTADLAARAAVFHHLGTIIGAGDLGIVSGTEDQIVEMPIVIRDNGHTELPRGTITAGTVTLA